MKPAKKMGELLIRCRICQTEYKFADAVILNTMSLKRRITVSDAPIIECPKCGERGVVVLLARPDIEATVLGYEYPKDTVDAEPKATKPPKAVKPKKEE